MDNLRLILLLVGIVVLVLIWALHKPEGRRRPGASRREPEGPDPATGRAESAAPEGTMPEQTTLPDLGDDTPASAASGPRKRREPVLDMPDDAGQDVPPEDAWRETEAVTRAAGRETVAPEDNAEAPRIVTLYLRARGNRKISGLSLLDAAIKAGLRFGEMKIFHRRHRGATRPVFSMANITRPGSFDPAGWNLFETAGVTLFLTLPGPVSALDAWDAMLATGQRLATILDADLMDDSHCLLTRQRIAQIREDMRDFDRKHGLGR